MAQRLANLSTTETKSTPAVKPSQIQRELQAPPDAAEIRKGARWALDLLGLRQEGCASPDFVSFVPQLTINLLQSPSFATWQLPQSQLTILRALVSCVLLSIVDCPAPLHFRALIDSVLLERVQACAGWCSAGRVSGHQQLRFIYENNQAPRSHTATCGKDSRVMFEGRSDLRK